MNNTLEIEEILSNKPITRFAILIQNKQISINTIEEFLLNKAKLKDYYQNHKGIINTILLLHLSSGNRPSNIKTQLLTILKENEFML